MRGADRVNLASIAQNARKGDQIVIEIRKVQRQNFRGNVEDFAKFNKYINISLQ